MQRLIAVVAFVLLALGPVRAADPSTPLTEVNWVTLSPQAADWPLFIGESQGIFRDEGLHVNIIAAGSPVNAINALATNAANISNNGTDNIIVAISHGLPLKIVGSTFKAMPYALLVPANIKTWADLKGKQITLATKADVTAVVFSQMAAQHGLTLDDFSIVSGGTSNIRFAALTSGNVQGAILSQPFDLMAEAAGMHVLSTAHDAMADWTFDSLDVNATWAQANRATVVKALRAMHRAMLWGYTHRDAAVALLVDKTHVDPAIAKSAYDLDFTKWHAFDENMRLSEASVRYIEKLQTNFGILSNPPSYSQVYDGSYAAEALK
jgi:NitT/TauT family transport system substrate-binding protein